MYENGPRNWKWMVPLALVAPCIAWWNAWFMWGGSWRMWAIVPACLCLVFGIAFIVNLYLYVAQHHADIFADVQVARNSTAEVRMFEAARGMHPEAVKALLVHRRTIWRIKYVPLKDVTDWIMDEAPTVHAGFVDFVLDHSNDVSLMPKRFLSDGSTQFDPEGIVLDYQQYDDLLFVLQQKLMVTQAFGNQSPHLLPPWTVQLLRKRFGLDGEGYQVDEGMSEAMKSVVRAQSRATPLSASTQTSPQMEERNLGGEVGVPNVIEKALEGLEQSPTMKANAARVYKLNS